MEMDLLMYNSPIDIIGILIPLIQLMFKCMCLTQTVELPWKPLLLHVWHRCVIPAFVAMKMRIMP